MPPLVENTPNSNCETESLVSLPKDNQTTGATSAFGQPSTRTYVMDEYIGPRRSLTPYMIFAEQKREEIQEDEPNIGMTQMQRKIARAWALLPKEDK